MEENMEEGDEEIWKRRNRKEGRRRGRRKRSDESFTIFNDKFENHEKILSASWGFVFLLHES